jgi:hypothetical protein
MGGDEPLSGLLVWAQARPWEGVSRWSRVDLDTVTSREPGHRCRCRWAELVAVCAVGTAPLAVAARSS